MRIAILSRNKNLYSTRRLIEAGKARGHSVRVLDHLKCFMDITSEKPTLHYKDEEFGADDFDAVIPRIGASVTSFGTAVLRQFEMMGVYCINESVAISRSRDKLRSLQLLSRKKIGIPVTAYAHNTESIDGLIREVGGAPVVIKLLEGTHGIGVVLAENKKAASSIIEAFMGLNANILVQEFIKESKGSDVRCFVVGGKVIAAMERRAAPGEFRSNLHRGGTAQLVKLTAAERRTAIKAANTMGMNMCGVDILRSDRGPLIMEVNSSPGLEGIETATQKDVAGMVYEFIEKNAGPHKNKTKGKG
ncbi:MAG: ribosomal protein S6--L-glutamate ligase [Candidatus Azotimanducaceae bacterium]|jgi:ribosomal protein S6--L-glutamate ligase